MMYSKGTRRKGVSPLIAAVLLIVFTIGVATIVMSWVNEYTKDTTEKASENTDQMMDCANTNIDIKDVYINYMGTDTTVKLIAANTGLSDLKVKEAYVMDTNGTRCFMDLTGSDTMDDTVFAKGNSFELINESCGLSFSTGCDGFDKAVVATTCGVSSSFEDAESVVCNAD